MCPNCRQNAPLVYRGALASCTACGAPRPPFAGKSVNLSGRMRKVGGAMTTAFGWLTVAIGTMIAVSLIWLLQLLVGGVVGWAVGVPVAFVALVIGLAMVFGGGRWRRSGAAAERATQMEAAYAMALHRGGTVTAADVSRTLHLPVEEADRLLTDMIKVYPDYISVEFDDEGQVFYRLAGVPGAPDPGLRRYRVQPDGRVRIDDSPSELEDEHLEDRRRQRT